MAMKTSTLDGSQITGLQDRLRNKTVFTESSGVLDYYGNKFEITYTSSLITISTGAILLDGTLCVNETQITQAPISTTAKVYLKARVNLSTGVSDIYQSLNTNLIKQDSVIYPSGTYEYLLATLTYPVTGTGKFYPVLIKTLTDKLSKIETDYKLADTVITDNAQMQKITVDNGAPIMVVASGEDAYVKFTALPTGIHFVALATGALNSPLSNGFCVGIITKPFSAGNYWTVSVCAYNTNVMYHASNYTGTIFPWKKIGTHDALGGTGVPANTLGKDGDIYIQYI
jgi:hypothetical protein